MAVRKKSCFEVAGFLEEAVGSDFVPGSVLVAAVALLPQARESSDSFLRVRKSFSIFLEIAPRVVSCARKDSFLAPGALFA